MFPLEPGSNNGNEDSALGGDEDTPSVFGSEDEMSGGGVEDVFGCGSVAEAIVFSVINENVPAPADSSDFTAGARRSPVPVVPSGLDDEEEVGMVAARMRMTTWWMKWAGELRALCLASLHRPAGQS